METVVSKVELPELNKILKTRGLQEGGKVQLAVDEAVVKYNRDYVPFLSGTLADSPHTSGIPLGHGIVKYNTPYAHYQYYLTDTVPSPNYSNNQSGLRGAYWNDRMKINRSNDILKEAKKALGGK